MGSRDEDGFLTHLTTPVGGELTDDELRAVEHYYKLEAGELVRGTRTGVRDVSVTKRAAALHKIEMVVVA